VLVITGVLKIPVTLVPIHLSYHLEKICSKDVRGWLVIHALVPHLGQESGAPGTVSAIPYLSRARVPGMVKGHLTSKIIAQRLRLDGNSRNRKAVWGSWGREGGWSCTITEAMLASKLSL